MVRTKPSELSGLATEEGEVRGSFVGFYWTLPVNWAGFRDLPPGIEAAALASRTIRYQRERVRRHLRDNGGQLVDEIAFMDVRPDRATETVRDVLQRKASGHAHAGVTLVTVAFEQAAHWRPNHFLEDAAQTLGLVLLRLPPDPVTIDNKVFDPARHFSAWRRQDESAMTRLKMTAREAISVAMADVSNGAGGWRQIADRLNDGGVKTIRGHAWTAENARKLAGRMAAIE